MQSVILRLLKRSENTWQTVAHKTGERDKIMEIKTNGSRNLHGYLCWKYQKKSPSETYQGIIFFLATPALWRNYLTRAYFLEFYQTCISREEGNTHLQLTLAIQSYSMNGENKNPKMKHYWSSQYRGTGSQRRRPNHRIIEYFPYPNMFYE